MHISKIAVLTARLYIKLVKRHHEPPVLLYFNGFPGWLAWFSLQIFCLNNEIHFSLANANDSASFKSKMVWKGRFLLIHKQPTNLWMKLPTIPARVSGQDRKLPPALGTNQIAGFGGFRPLASLEKNKTHVLHRSLHIDEPCWLYATLYLTKKPSPNESNLFLITKKAC